MGKFQLQNEITSDLGCSPMHFYLEGSPTYSMGFLNRHAEPCSVGVTKLLFVNAGYN